MDYSEDNSEQIETNSKAVVHDILAKRSFGILKQKFNNSCHRNPFTNKIVTRVIKSKRKLMNSMVNEINSNIEHLENTKSDPELLKQFNRLLNSLKEYDKPEETIEEQLSDLKPDSKSMGVMDFQWDINKNETYINSFTLIIGASKSGKSVLTNQLIFELPQSFDKICFFMGKDSWMNKCPKVLEHICKRSGVKTQWINTDKDSLQIEFSDNEDQCYKDLNPDGSSKFVYRNTMYGSVYIFDDLYTCKNPNIINFIDQMAVMGRHMKVNTFVCFQGFTKLSNKILDNATRIFLNYNILEREDLWRKLKLPPPDNLDQVINDIRGNYHSRWYYIDDIYLEPYEPYSFANQGQVIDKMKAKLPRNIKNEKIKKEFEAKQKELDKLRQQLKIPDSVESLLTNGQQYQVEDKGPKRIMLTDPKDAHVITMKEWNQELELHDPSKFNGKPIRNLRAKYKI